MTNVSNVRNWRAVGRGVYVRTGAAAAVDDDREELVEVGRGHVDRSLLQLVRDLLLLFLCLFPFEFRFAKSERQVLVRPHVDDLLLHGDHE